MEHEPAGAHAAKVPSHEPPQDFMHPGALEFQPVTTSIGKFCALSKHIYADAHTCDKAHVLPLGGALRADTLRAPSSSSPAFLLHRNAAPFALHQFAGS